MGRPEAIADQGVKLGILFKALLGLDFFKLEAKDFEGSHGQSTKVAAMSVYRRDITFALYPLTEGAVSTVKKGAHMSPLDRKVA